MNKWILKNFHKDRSSLYWWKDEEESLKIVRLCPEESNQCTNKKEFIQAERTEKDRRRPKITENIYDSK